MGKTVFSARMDIYLFVRANDRQLLLVSMMVDGHWNWLEGESEGKGSHTRISLYTPALHFLPYS
jgi:hypothetical protein